MIPEEEKNDFDRALCKHFRPAVIEELWGLEFHHRMQGMKPSNSTGKEGIF